MKYSSKMLSLADIGTIVSGGTPSTKEPTYWNGEIPWVTPADLSGYSEKYISKGAKSITQSGLENSSAKLMPKDSVLFSSRAPIGYVAIAMNVLCTNQGFKSIIPNQDLINSDYLYYYLKFGKHLAEDLASGTTFKEISGKNFAKIQIPVPSLEEQKLITEKIEILFCEIDQGAHLLELLLNKSLYLKQSILKQAFEGKLI